MFNSQRVHQIEHLRYALRPGDVEADEPRPFTLSVHCSETVSESSAELRRIVPRSREFPLTSPVKLILSSQ